MAARPDPELLEREIEAKMIRWMEQRGVTVVFHSSPPISERRWIGVVTTGGLYSDHCLLMSGRDCLFDPASLLPPRRDQPVSGYDLADIDYGITIERR